MLNEGIGEVGSLELGEQSLSVCLDRSIMYTNAVGQVKWCYTHNRVLGRSELQPGDLVFWQDLSYSGCSHWQEVHHIGIYIEDGKVIGTCSSKGRVLVHDLWESWNCPLQGFGRLNDTVNKSILFPRQLDKIWIPILNLYSLFLSLCSFRPANKTVSLVCYI